MSETPDTWTVIYSPSTSKQSSMLFSLEFSAEDGDDAEAQFRRARPDFTPVWTALGNAAKAWKDYWKHKEEVCHDVQ